MNYDKDIEEYWAERMPEEIKVLANKANNDLYSGPSYYDEDGNEMSCFDEGAVPFDFRAACRAIKEWCDDNMYTLYLEDWCGILQVVRPEEFEEVENEDGEVELIEIEKLYYEWDTRDQMKIVFGEELARYL
jgi:hypothetical protein